MHIQNYFGNAKKVTSGRQHQTKFSKVDGAVNVAVMAVIKN
jgi:hypothetical protein